MKNMEGLDIQNSFTEDTNHSRDSVSTQALLDLLSTEPPKTINVIEMITKSGGHICSGIQGPSPELIDRIVDLSDI
ncbi:hypothetical protein [Microcoleus sp. bin38.metabat.b11b12b14.051]|uniref:hypothetical protein n=1 Tax=Microcoleus sp. bin38.metabat.b11b12b14.051 TaxID=2742709 RepID=UPI0025FC50E8|nr:hypothetical protein [Microcoleus sp. bin38.metabat.b11b12b14.051]